MYHLSHINKQEFSDVGEMEMKLRKPKDINLSKLLKVWNLEKLVIQLGLPYYYSTCQNIFPWLQAD